MEGCSVICSDQLCIFEGIVLYHHIETRLFYYVSTNPSCFGLKYQSDVEYFNCKE